LVVASDVALTADPARPRQLLENLFRNSVEHGQSGAADTSAPTEACTDDRPTVRIGGLTLQAAAGDDERFFVEDAGCGLPEETHRVFEIGFTTNDEGTGPGLAISERIAEAHGWEVHASAGESGGAWFEFRTS
jgi:signal transduction histidine kinase